MGKAVSARVRTRKRLDQEMGFLSVGTVFTVRKWWDGKSRVFVCVCTGLSASARSSRRGNGGTQNLAVFSLCSVPTGRPVGPLSPRSGDYRVGVLPVVLEEPTGEIRGMAHHTSGI